MKKERCVRCDALCIRSHEGMCVACHEAIDGNAQDNREAALEEWADRETDRLREEAIFGLPGGQWIDEE